MMRRLIGRGARPWGPRGTAAATIAARLTFRDVTHRYEGVGGVTGVDLDVAPGEIISLLGHSGCGKTTLLRLAAGIERPVSGAVLINDREVAGPDRFVPPERRGVGLMFQDYALFPHLTTLENVMFGLSSMDREIARHEAEQALTRVGLAESADDYPHMLSGGEQQRVALARAIAPRPSVLLMDEPFSNLDRRMRDRVRDETLAVVREMRATTILVTHDPEEALMVADRIALMRSGRVVQIGTAHELYDAPADVLAARFFSALNEFEAVAGASGVETPFGLVPLPAGLSAGTPVTVCIRPGQILLEENGAGVEGRVLRQRFLGEVDLLEVAAAGFEAPLFVRSREVGRFARGANVRVAADPSQLLVFEKAESTPT
ncbi:MAG: ABC transporter ATP-binding protein [Hyphomicrobiaceae bacterium]|nr:ABC transporter ATP-binding protein [Hyphomicrobiaceae bacterium]